MQTSYPIGHRKRGGYALILTLTFLAVSLVTLSSVLLWVATNSRVTQRNVLFTTAESAAEAATEEVIATLDRDWTYGQKLQAAGIYTQLVPAQTGWPMHFQYSNGSGNNNLNGMTIGIQYFTNKLGSTFQNLSGYQQDCTITSTATTPANPYAVSATVQQVVKATIIPLFQFAVFYNLNLEIDPGTTMSLNGPVFGNQGIWAGTANITFNSTVATAGLIYDQATDTTNADPWCSGKTDSGTPNGNFKITPVSKADSLSMPIGTNNNPSAVEAILNLPPSDMSPLNPTMAYSTNGQMYLFNESDLIISNAAAGLAGPRSSTNITIWFQDPINVNPLTQITNDFYALKSTNGWVLGWTNVINNASGIDSLTNVLYAGYSFVTNVQFYDFRETDTNQAVQIDVSQLNKWLTNKAATGGNSYNKSSFADKGRGISSIYIYNSVTKTNSRLPSVRLVNGAQLPYTTDPNGTGRTTGGLTVATPQPLYVKGNYNVQTASSAANASANTTNTANTYPAALMGDAVTILSSSWNDIGAAYQSGGAVGSRVPVATTVNAACLEGIVQSTNSNYSGGLENFLRLEESWTSSIAVTYNGSIVVMFGSIYATSPWNGNYYGVPQRNWGFDLNFTDPGKLPPNTPKSYKIIRSSWRNH